MRIILFIFCLLPFVGNEVAMAIPAQVIIIRHAEKPNSGDDLSPKGYQRAQALVGFFQNNSAMLQFGLPIAIYAMAPKKGGSKRAIETVQPLASALGQQLHTNYTRQQIQPLANEIMQNPSYDGKMVLICWEHNMIPPLADDFGGNMAPTSWADSVFDRAWVLTFKDGKIAFENVPQHLLPGDSSN